MADVAIGPPVPSEPSPRLNVRARLWHWSEAGTSLEFNSYLTHQARQSVPLGWHAHFVEVPSFSCSDPRSFVPIEVDFVHDRYTYDHPRAPVEWENLCKTIQGEVTRRFFRDIGGVCVICQIQSIAPHTNGQSVLVAVDFRHGIDLVERVIITPRPRSSWTQYWRYFRSAYIFGLGIAFPGRWLPPGSARSLAAIGAVYTLVSYYVEQSESPSVRDQDPLSRIANSFSLYRRRFADWKQAMSLFNPSYCPGSGMKAVEACHRLLVAYDQLHVSVSTYVDPIETERSWVRTAALVAGAVCALCGGVFTVALASTTLLQACGCVGFVVGAGSAYWGWCDPGHQIRERKTACKDAFLATQITLRILFVRTLVCFLQDGLHIPYDRLSESEATALLRSCGIDSTFLDEVGYQTALPKRGTAHFEHCEGNLRESFKELFSILGHDIIFQATPADMATD